MSYIIATLSIIAIACIAAYFLSTKEEEEESFFIVSAMCLVIFGICVVPSVILMGFIEHFNILEGNKGLPLFLPIIIFGLFVAWATHGKPESNSGTDDKKDDFTADAIVLTTVLTEDKDSKGSSNSSSSGSISNSSSSSNSDDFFFL